MANNRIGLEAVLLMDDFDAGVKRYESGKDILVKASTEMGSAASKQLVSYTDLAQTLSNTGPQQAAAVATERLKASFADGSLTAEQYASAITQVQDEFGLVSSEGKAAAGSLIAAEEAFAAGEISAEEYAAELKKVAGSEEKAGMSAVEMAASIELVEKAYAQVKDVIGQALELAQLGATAERVEQRFEAFAGQIGDAGELLKAFQEGAGGTVDKMTAMTAASRLMQMGLVTNADEMRTVVELATRLGDQTASAGDRVSDFSLLLANQSIPRLDNFGISSGRVRERIAELTTGVDALSREAAFSQAVFEQGGLALDILGERVDDSAASFERAQAKMADLRVEVGQKLAPAGAALMDLFSRLNSTTIVFAAGIAGTVLAVAKFGPVLSALKAQILATSTASLGLVAAVAGLVIAVQFASDKMNEMNQSQEESKQAAASLGDQVNELVAGGMSLGDAMDVAAGKMNIATGELDDLGVVAGFAMTVLGGNAEAAKTLGIITDSLNSTLAANTSTYAEYTQEVEAYNASVTDQASKVATAAEIQLKMTTEIDKSGGVMSEAEARTLALADSTVMLTEAEFNILAKRRAVAEATEKGVVLMKAWDDELVIAANETDNLAAATGDLTDQQIELQQHFGQLAFDQAEATENSKDFSAELMRQQQQSAIVVSELDSLAGAYEMGAVSTKDFLSVQEQTTKELERVARAEERSAATAQAAALAMDVKREADIALAQEEAALAQSVLGASDAMIAQSFIQGLDPEAMGLIAYRDAVENIQLSFGLATPESIALSRGMTAGIEAANAGEIAYKDLDKFIIALREDAADGAVDFDTLSREFASSAAQSEFLATRIDETGDALTDTVSATEELIRAEEGLEAQTKQAADQALNFSGLVANVADDTELWTDSITGTERAISDTQVTTEQWADAMQGLDQKLVATGEDALSTTEKVEALNATFSRSDDASLEAAGGLDAVQGSAGEAALAIEELEGVMSDTAAAATAQGAAIGNNLAAGLLPAIDALVDQFRAQLAAGISDPLPSSEPKDTTSPLFGLGKRGEAIIGNIVGGIEKAGPDLARAMSGIATDMNSVFFETLDVDLFDLAGTLGGLGGAAAGLLQRRRISPLEEAVRAGESERDRIEKLLEAISTERAGLLEEAGGGVSGERALQISERLAELERTRALLFGNLVANQEQMTAAAQELADQQERILRLQEAQERLGFLQQQAKLLDLIAEKGLDASAILSGMELGVDASVEDVVDAMARAIEAIVEQANAELGIASPSRVFEKIGGETMTGMAMGIQRLMGLPVAQSAIATRAMVAAPAMIAGARSSSTDNSRTMGDVNINNPVLPNQGAQDQLLATIRREIASSLRGTR